MKVELTEEQKLAKREYNRQAKKKSREKALLNRPAESLDEAIAAFREKYPERIAELNAQVKSLALKVSEELARPLGSPRKDDTGMTVGYDDEENYLIDRVARILHGLNMGWISKIEGGDEIVSGLYYADCFGSAVESAHQYGLKASPTFAEKFHELLELLNKRYPDGPDAKIIRLELAGKYQLPPEPPKQKQPEPIPVEPDPIPSDKEILDRARTELEQRIGSVWQPPHLRVPDPNLAPDARRYLDGV